MWNKKRGFENGIGSSKQWMASPSLGTTTTYKIVFYIKKFYSKGSRACFIFLLTQFLCARKQLIP